MLSIPHLIVIFVIALIVLGPEKLPQVARVLGKAMAITLFRASSPAAAG